MSRLGMSSSNRRSFCKHTGYDNISSTHTDSGFALCRRDTGEAPAPMPEHVALSKTKSLSEPKTVTIYNYAFMDDVCPSQYHSGACSAGFVALYRTPL